MHLSEKLECLRQRYPLAKIIRIMKLATFFILAFFIQASARSEAQQVSIVGKNLTLKQVFHAIAQQTGYVAIYEERLIQNAKTVNLNESKTTLFELLEKCFSDQDLTFVIKDKSIVVKEKRSQRIRNDYAKEDILNPIRDSLIDIQGTVRDERGNPISGAIIQVKGIRKGTTTNISGQFRLTGVDENSVLQISNLGYTTQEIRINNSKVVQVVLKVSVDELDETIVMAYGKTSKRLNTGNISKVTSEELASQPVSNPLLALAGRVPGLSITQSSGLNGAAVKAEIRGQNSILQGSEPLYIIDGIPYAAGNNRLNQITNATSEVGMSPLNLISMENIESIEVLKDADATAIYGSRGANGVILITTKGGVSGKTTFRANVNYGISRVTRTMDMLNTQQYVQMRREAFANEGIIPSSNINDPGYAPDIMIWDTTRFNNIKDLLIGGTAKISNAQISVSGGSASTQFLIGASYQRQTTVLPTNDGEEKANVNFNINHTSTNKKFSIKLNGNYLSNTNKLNVSDLTAYINMPPNIKLYESDGSLSWGENNVSLWDVLFRENPLSKLQAIYNGRFKNLLSNMNLNYAIINGLNAKVNLGYNLLQANEYSAEPSSSITPNIGNLPSANFANRAQSSWIIEPQLEYFKATKFGTFNSLLGTTWQENNSDGLFVQAFNYSSDILLRSVSGAGVVRTSNNFSQYRYSALFGRFTYNLKDRYIINASGRRDGSSRFGPNKRFSNFGAIGVAWIFSNEKLFAKRLNFLSFGKVRASYGVTGNDQIGDYRYLDNWTITSNTYQGIAITNPNALYNPDFSWERNRKLEAALELGFFNNKIMLSAAYYQNRGNNQLISYSLPIQTGFNNVLTNLNAELQNSGLEIQIASKNISNKVLTWSSSMNLSFNRNRLLSFPGLSNSSYVNNYFIGMPIGTRKLYRFVGVDPLTGLYSFDDADGNGILNSSDRVLFQNVLPQYIGGLSNTLKYKTFSLSLFFEFRKQMGYDFLTNNVSVSTPGYDIANQPLAVLSRWRELGNVSNVQRFGAGSSSPVAGVMNQYLPISNGNISDASFIRCKNISLSYSLPTKFLKSFRVEKSEIYVQAQNLFVISKYKGADPENQNLFVLPPLRSVVIGVNLTF
jgi:TonB-dependent starch-binding outer membrane protein SusC